MDLVVGAALNNSLHTTGQSVRFVAFIFALTVAIEFLYLWLRWRKYGAPRVARGVLVANVVSYALLIPIAFLSMNVGG